ncbi:MAG: hypothetical protein JNL10_19435 [Verrucomicrobiales bacterium]|nr:hypothetical protein [Verrucomicrobiales bacterium]
MFAVFQRRPALALLLGSWLLPIIMVLLSEPLLEKPVALGTWILIGCAILAAAMGLLLGPRPQETPQRMASDRLVLGLVAFGGVCGLLFWYMSRGMGSSMEETRHLVHQKALGMGREAYLFHAGGAASLMGIAMAALHRKPFKMLSLALIVALVCWAGFMIIYAARVYSMICVAIALCGFVTRFPKQIFSPRGFALGVAILIPLYILNVLFVEKRMESNFADPAFGEHITAKASTLIRVQDGGIRANSFVISAVWLLLQFSSDPVYYLDFYRTLNISHDYGLYQFSLIANRVPGYDWQDRRNELDLMYESIGITTNVWGTGIRDAAIDFGEVGAVLMFFFMGYAASKMGAARTLGGRALGIFLMQWLLYSPFTSPITHRPYQAALFFLLVWHFVELRMLRRTEALQVIAQRGAENARRGPVEMRAA